LFGWCVDEEAEVFQGASRAGFWQAEMGLPVKDLIRQIGIAEQA
jgi:hypothetical protein